MKSFFSKKSILGTMAVAAVCMLGTGNAQAQEFTIQGDLVSSYVSVSYTHLDVYKRQIISFYKPIRFHQ